MAFKYRSIRWELCFAVGVPLLAVYLMVLGMAYYGFRKHAYEGMSSYMTEHAALYAERFNEAFSVAAQVAKTTASFLDGKTAVSEKEIYRLLRNNVSGNPLVYGSAAAFEENAFDPSKKLFGPYVCRKTFNLETIPPGQTAGTNKGLFREIDIAKDAYDYRQWDWYLLPKKKRAPVWTEPYFDKGAGNIIMCTFSAPFFENEKFKGVLTVDVRVQDLHKLINKDSLVNQNAFVIISREGRYISHPNPEYIMKETIFSNAEKIKRPELVALGHKMTTGGKGIVLIKDFQGTKKIFVFYAPISSTGWSFAATVPEDEVMKPVWQQLAKFGTSMCVGFLLMAILLLIISARIAKPIIKLAHVAEQLGKGDFNVSLEENYGNNEIGNLAESFKKMTRDLKNYMEALTRETAIRQRVESELQLARNIQLSLLPKTFPDRREFDLYGKNDAAQFVAGDFFDYFFVGENTLAFAIADVSGKGISAAMFMVITRTLLRNLASQKKPPAEVLDRINQLLLEENESGMFVTMFFSYCDIKTGEIWYANAGHQQPFCMSKERTTRKFGIVTGPPLGIAGSVKYEMKKEILEPGEALILYTDGFTEARAPSGEFLQEERFQGLLRDNMQDPMKKFCEKVFQRTVDFQHHKLSDDLTLLVLKRRL
ncbi:MAG: SpoIIE family protein phosphatase [Candidatus Omnitrophota bacterium]